MTLVADLKHSFCFLLFLFLVSCSGEPKVFNFKGDAFGTFYDVKVITTEDKVEDIKTVSYTHLTLPTKRIV